MTILSFGGGQDSTAILYKLHYDLEFRSKYVTGNLIVVMSDTGDEFDQTYDHLEKVQNWCSTKGIDFHLIGISDGYHTGDWAGGLIGFYEAGNRIGSKAFPKSCTDKLKIGPIYHWLDAYLHQYKGYGKFNKNGKLAKTPIKEFTEKHGKIRVLLGIAKGEEKRAGSNEDSPSKWMRECIDKVYPLIEVGMDRQACQDYIELMGHKVPFPSNCKRCPWLNEIELLYLYRFEREAYDEWVQLEASKIAANTHKGDKNLGVWGEKLLPQKMEEVIQKHGHMSNEELKEYRMSHGHCVMSKY